MNTIVRKMGNSSGVIISAELLSKVGLKAGDDIYIYENREQLVITRVQSNLPYSINELASICNGHLTYIESSE